MMRQRPSKNPSTDGEPSTKGGDQALPSAPLVLLGVSAFLAPLLGGYLAAEPQPLEPGFGPLIVAIAQGMDLPILGHAVVAAFAALAFAVCWVRNRVVPLPFSPLAVCVACLTVLIGLSLASSRSLWGSLVALSEWLVYLFAMAAVWSACGRKRGVEWVLGGLAVGCTLAAINAILEYGGMRSQDPSWRVFGPWMNPNALAGMLVLGWFSAIALTLRAKRAAVLVWAGAAVLIGTALGLTQSKGGLVAASVGLVACLTAIVAWGGSARSFAAPTLRVLGVLATCVLLLLSMRFSGRPPGASAHATSPTLLSRVAASATEDHSSAFRKLLWESCVELMKARPLGVGIGTFSQHSASPGLTPQTRLAHNSFLQLGAEAGVLAMLAFALFGVLWLREVLRSARSLPLTINLTRACVLGAVAASVAHNIVDSDLYYFGSGLGLFLSLGVGVSLSADALTPEQLPRAVRLTGGLAAIAAALSLLYAGWVQAVQGRLVRDLLALEPESAVRGANMLRTFGSLDSQSWMLIARTEPTWNERIEDLRRAAALSPSPRTLRDLARALEASGQPERALIALQEALVWDARNLPTLEQTMRLHLRMGDAEQATKVALKLVEVEGTPYFRVRATPEFVPTETFRARLYLASRESEAAERARLLAPAVAGYVAFLEKTLPRVAEAARASPTLAMGGVALEDAKEALRDGLETARLLERAYRELGRADDAAEASATAARFAEAERELEAIPR